MITENRTLMVMAREDLKGRWGIAIAVYLLYAVITGSAGSLGEEGSVIGLIISGPMSLGIAMVSLDFSRRKEVRIEHIFRGFRDFGTSLGCFLLSLLYVLLWSLLLIVPGIIAAISYSMVFYIIAEEKPSGIRVTLERSRALMNGYKMKFFCLCIRFFGLALLCILTLGIGFLWLIPYWHVCSAKFYEDIVSAESGLN